MSEENTVKKQLAQELTELEKRVRDYDHLLENTFDVIFQTTRTGKFTYTNAASERIAGYKPQEIIGKSFTKFVPKKELPRYFSRIRKMLAGEDVGSFETYVVHKDGHLIPVEFSGRAIRKGDKVFINGVMRDITERIHAVNAMQESEERFRLLFENSPDAITLLDRSGTIIDLNESTERLTGYTKEELVRKSFDKLLTLDPKDLPKLREKYVNLSTGRKVDPYELEIIRKDGSRRWINVVNSALFKEGKVECLQIIARDITKNMEAKREILRTKEYLQNIIDSASECIIAITPDNKVSTWNQTMEVITGYKQREIIGKPLSDLSVFEKPGGFLDYLNNVYQGETHQSYELLLNPKTGGKRLVRVSGSVIKSGGEYPTGVLLVGKDITLDSELHGRLLQGNSYLVIDSSKKSSLNLLVDLTLSGYQGLWITRDHPESIHTMLPEINAEVLMLSQDKMKGFDYVADLDELTARVARFMAKNTRSVILLDRIDYLLTGFTFEGFLQTLYQLTNMTMRHGAIMLLRINPSLVNKRQMALLEEELQPLPNQKIEHLELEEKLYDILTFISEQNQRNVLVTHKKIGEKISITKVTVAKRIKSLQEKGLIYVQSRGRSKTIHLTEKGKTLLHRRTVI
jgi:PAS domain S-box-containing protein